MEIRSKNTKAIILAAGRGMRLNKYTNRVPKGMLEVDGKTIIRRQIDTYIDAGISDISIVTGYMGETINYSGVKSYKNERYASTNMVESLFSAEEELEGDVIVSYSDILFEPRVLAQVETCKEDIGVAVDSAWQDYWRARYGRIDFDTESLQIGPGGNITELGSENPKIEEIDGRYVGLIRLSAVGCQIFKEVYHANRPLYAGKIWLNGRNFENMFMTDFLQALINQGVRVAPIIISKGWYEFDTNEDYENFISSNANGLLRKYFNF